ncbi:MAG: glycosyltransferase, partial [Planctomycetota bacterium]
MKLMVLWDPHNEQVPVTQVIKALQKHVEVFHLTFDDGIPRMLPNGRFDIDSSVKRFVPDAILWVEGGPLPRNLHDIPCIKACWMTNAHLEPTILDDIGHIFDVRLTSWRAAMADERFKWLPLCSSGDLKTGLPAGEVSIICDDPMPPSHVEAVLTLRNIRDILKNPPVSIAVCPGQNACPNPRLFDIMAAGAVAIVDKDSDLRDIANPGEHLMVYPSTDKIGACLKDIESDYNKTKQMAKRSVDIINHLHTPELRAQQLLNFIWSKSRVLSGMNYKPIVSILTCCYKFKKRFSKYLDSIARQNLPSGSIEIVVADPESPDGLAAYLQDFASQNSHLRIIHLPMNPIYHKNRGVSINRAFDASTGNIIISTDGDIIFPPDLIPYIINVLKAEPNKVLGVRRRFLNKEVTDRILSGEPKPMSMLL